MKQLIIFALVIGQFSCTDKRQTDNTQDIKDTLQNINDIKLTESINPQTELLNVDTLTEAEFISLFKEKLNFKYDIHKDKRLERDIKKSYDFWVGKRVLINDTLKKISIWGYPKSFKEKKHKIKWTTTLGEGENHNQMRLFTLDKYFNQIDNAMITSYGGDEGISSWSLGEFKNDSTYVMKTFMTGYETDSIENTISSCLIIHSNGKIERIENCR
jgi:hypothetical protein